MAFDATSLYPSAMMQIESFPDLTSAFVVDSTFDIKSVPFYMINCDVYLP